MQTENQKFNDQMIEWLKVMAFKPPFHEQVLATYWKKERKISINSIGPGEYPRIPVPTNQNSGNEESKNCDLKLNNGNNLKNNYQWIFRKQF